MNIREYLENPIGKGDASIPNKSLIIAGLDSKYEKYIKSKTKKIDMKMFRDGKTGDYYFYLVLPSETARTNTYDVIYRFYDSESRYKKNASIAQYDIQVFTNTPSFAYTYAFVYDQAGMIIPGLKPKLGKTFFTKEPVVRNRNQNLMYDKYLYFAAKYIIDSKFMNRLFLESRCMNYSASYFQKHVRTLNTILTEYDAAAKKLKKDERGKKIQVGREKTHSTSGSLRLKPISKHTGTVNKSSKNVSKTGHLFKKRGS